MPNGIKKPRPPRGYGVYRAISRARYPRVTTLSPKGYRRFPIRAFETVIHPVRPRKWIRQLRTRYRAIMGIAAITRRR